MTRYEPQQTRQVSVFYAEEHSAIRWPYYFYMVFWGTVLAATIAEAAITRDPNWSFSITAGIVGTLLAVGFTIQNWPVGIMAGSDGIRIGAVRRAPKPRGKQPWADYQRWQPLFAPWDAVRRVAVITDAPSLRDARSLRSKQDIIIRVGVLTAPLTKAVLLIEVDPDKVVVPDFHEPHTERQHWRYSHLTPFEVSPVWYVPTRHPEALRAALARHAVAIPGTSSPRLPAYLRLLFERASG